MGTANSVIPNLRPLSIWAPRSLWIGLFIVMFSLPAAAFADLIADDDDDDADAPLEVEFEDAAATVSTWISDANAARHTRERLLRRRIAFVDQVCGLTDAQKQRIELAFQGDIKRYLDRIHEIETNIELVKIDAEKVRKLINEAHQFKQGVSTEDSLAAKILERVLTPQQRDRYEPFRMVIHVGGQIQTEEPGSGEVLEIDVHGTAFGDDDAAHFRNFPRLLRLFLENTQVTDDGLAHLKGLTKLEWLDIGQARVTDAGLAHLHGLTNVQWLSLVNTHVSDSGLVHLKGLSRLQSLRLEGTQVTDAGLVHLQGFTRLERLSLAGTRVTDAGVAMLLRALPKLTIKVSHSPVHGIARPGVAGRGMMGGMGGGFF